MWCCEDEKSLKRKTATADVLHQQTDRIDI